MSAAMAALTRRGARAAACCAAVALAGCGSARSGPAATATATATAAATAAVTAARPVPRPAIASWPIPFGARRRAETARYAERHYGRATYRLGRPRVIVEHYTQTSTARQAWSTFANDVPDVELHELPQVCAHFLVDRDGTIYRLVSPRLICRHTVGLNDVAIGIEHVGLSDGDVMGDRRELRASLALTRWLRCRYGIAARDVIGHSESLGSPYHHERVAALRRQTHADMAHATMQLYRALLRRSGC
jgi:N-acetylmuramoyl-L-alanine amidase